jgi:hypothetical protein
MHVFAKIVARVFVLFGPVGICRQQCMSPSNIYGAIERHSGALEIRIAFKVLMSQRETDRQKVRDAILLTAWRDATA